HESRKHPAGDRKPGSFGKKFAGKGGPPRPYGDDRKKGGDKPFGGKKNKKRAAPKA
ncbi:hypothetical protein HI113_43125, partial [Corallococcus exiguus]|nr:hypothetical protein [Corallococcus exiguus]